MTNIKLELETSWKEKLKNEFNKEYFNQIRSFLSTETKNGKTLFPPSHLILSAFNSTPFDKVKIVILGQDPYHGSGQAMGLSFSVPKGLKVPPSLKNIYKELNTDLNFEIPSHGDLSSWAAQGVFLLNAFLTVESGKAGSHQKIGWHIFTDQVITTLSKHKEHLVFMLWGNFAKKKQILIDSNKHLVLQAAHPSPLARGAYFGSKHFSQANNYLSKHDIKPIEWQI